MKNYLLALCMGIAVFSNSQNKINQLDSAGKKHGPWIVYLDNNWKEVTDSTKASFSRYAYFYNGINNQPVDPCQQGWYFLNNGGNNLQRGRTKLLDGQYTWTDNRGNTRCVALFKNGECQYFKWYYPSGTIQTYYNYTKNWKDQDHSYFISAYDKNGIATYSYWRKGPDGWGSLVSNKDGI
jgi:hypothetical protein